MWSVNKHGFKIKNAPSAVILFILLDFADTSEVDKPPALINNNRTADWLSHMPSDLNEYNITLLWVDSEHYDHRGPS